MSGKSFGERSFWFKALTLFVSLLPVLFLSACGGGGSSSGAPSGNNGGGGNTTGTVSGVAATGKPIAGVTVTLVDSKGHTLTTSNPTGTDGSFSISGTETLTPPFLLKITSNAGSTAGKALYSVSAGAGATQIINITPLTDMIVRTYYQVQGTSADTAFAGLANGTASGTYAPPTPAVVATIAQTVKTIVQSVLSNAGITNTSNFDPIAGAIIANTGSGGNDYDKALDNITVYTPAPTGVTVQTSTGTITVTASSSAGISETTTSSDGTSTTVNLPSGDYSASGTYSYDAGSGAFMINATGSDFPCNGPKLGSESWTANFSSTGSQMTWTKANGHVMVWTSTGAPSGIVGTWTYTDLSTGDQFTLTLNQNLTFSVTGSDVSSCGGSSGSTTSGVESASGTFTLSPNNTLSILADNSSFTNGCGPEAEQAQSFTVSGASGTSMTWAKTSGTSSDNLIWNRAGSGTGLPGTWTMTDPQTGNTYTANISSNGTWTVVAGIVNSCNGEGGSSGSGSMDGSGGGTTGGGTYSASGTLGPGATASTIIINATSSDYPCDGPEVGQPLSFALSNATATSMLWTGTGGNSSGSTLNWSILSGTAGSNLAGTWTATTNGNTYTVTVNPDGAWSMTGTLASTACSNAATFTGTWTDTAGTNPSANGTFMLTVANGQLSNDQFPVTSGGYGIYDPTGGSVDASGNFTFTSPGPVQCPGATGELTGTISNGKINGTWTRNADGTCVAEQGTVTGQLATSQQYLVPIQVTGQTDLGTSIQVCVNYGSAGNSECGPDGGFAIGSTGSITATALPGTGYRVFIPGNQPMAQYCSVTNSTGVFGSTMQTADITCR